MNTYFKIGSNMRERNTQAALRNDPRPQRVDFLYSYDTPVAMYVRAEDKLYVTNERWSATTQRHIKRWLSKFRTDIAVTPCPQATIDTMHHRANLWEAAQAGVTA